MKYNIFNKYDKLFAFSSERNGLDEGNYGNFNVCSYVGDTPEHVKRNRLAMCQCLSIDYDRLIMPRQTHTNNVLCIDQSFIAQPSHVKDEMLMNVDGLITNIKDVCIGINTADCIPIILFDPVQDVVATIHAGWRGVVSHITYNAVQTMVTKYGCAAENIICAVGPHISVEAYEVGEDLKSLFTEAGFNADAIFETSPSWTKCHLNLKSALAEELNSCGINPQNIEYSDTCTFCHSDQFFSARRLGINSGRIFTGAILK